MKVCDPAAIKQLRRPTMSHHEYENPLTSRYASEEMRRLFGDQRKFSTWRRLWLTLATAQKQLGLPITDAQLAEMRAHLDDIDWDAAAAHERRLRHDVMAHVHTFGDACTTARPIIHLGATSCFVTDNTDLMLMREALGLVIRRVVAVIDALASLAARYRDLPTLGYTHYQPAQPTTVGKRACLWAYDLVLDLAELEHRRGSLLARGVKGTTGTQASFLALFGGDHDKVRKLEELVAREMGFAGSYAVTGQTYSRKVDAQVVESLSSVAQSAHKAATDLRLLAGRREIEEPFEEEQVGSSAMAYKRNPMRCERICGLARYAMSLSANTSSTAAVQWLERTLDDSANRRIVLPQAFLAVDAILSLYHNVATGLVVNANVIGQNLRLELPFMATENILMAAVAAGGDRQDLHERIRRHSHAAADALKQGSPSNDLLERLAEDPAFENVDFDEAVNPAAFVGRAPEQVDEFLADVIAPIRRKYEGKKASEAPIWV